MQVSVGLFAHNEEKTIKQCIESFKHQGLNDITLVSSSTDNTNTIAKTTGIRVIEEKKRNGKARAINRFLSIAKGNILVICSADVIPADNAIKELCKPFADKKIGIVACRPIPIQKRYLGKITELLWKIHHEISLKKPKFGEMIAFRNVIKKIPNTSVDEETIAMLIMKKGYEGFYNPRSIVYNTGALSIKDYVTQRRRIFSGHLNLKKQGYTPATAETIGLLRTIIQQTTAKNILYMISLWFLELAVMFFGMYDYITGKKHYKWKLIKRS